MGQIVTMLALLFSISAQALEQWHLPIEKELKTLRIFNRDNQARPLWISGPILEYRDPMEVSYEVPAFGTLEIPLNEFLDFPWIHLKTQDAGILQVEILTRYKTSILLNSGPSLLWKSRIRPQSQAVILNLAPFDQQVSIGQDGKKIQSLTLPYLGKARISLEQYSSGSMLTFEGQARIAGLMISPYTTKAFAPDSAKVVLNPTVNLQTHYFRLSNKTNRQSYVAAISDPDLVKQAQLQVREPSQSLPRILIGEIDYGNGGFNRDFSDVRSNPWSWNIKRVIRFSQLASQECDGSPAMLEELLMPWKENSGVICFWGYRILEELSLEQIKTGRLSTPPARWSLQREH